MRFVRSCLITIVAAAIMSGCKYVPTSPTAKPVVPKLYREGGPGFDGMASDSAVDNRGGGHGYGSGN